MTPELTKPQYALEQLADLNRTLEKEKVQLTPEVEEYTRSHVRAVQDKLQAGKPVYESDLEFIEKVKMWVEAIKRKISLKQWLDLSHVAKASGKEKEWIDETFQFPGEGKIKTAEDLDLHGCTGLTGLPDGLSVGGYLDLSGCTGLTGLPEGLTVGGDLGLHDCTGLTELPEGLSVKLDLYLDGCTGLTKLPECLDVGGYLILNGCTGLTGLPEGLEVGGSLWLSSCTGLTGLPEGLKVGGNLYLSKDINEQVIKDAERLKEEGKIKGEIKYES